MTLSTAFDPHRNSLNAVRLLLAGAVLVSHTWPVGGYGAEPAWGGQTLGGWSVLGFFSISGFLITRSRLARRPARAFYRARFLRIYPGFAVCLLVIAFVFAPLSLLLDRTATYSPGSAFSFLAHNFLLYPPKGPQVGIAGTLSSVPFPGYWDGPLWTLFFEALAYVGIGVLVSVVPRSLLPRTLVAVFLVATVVEVAGRFGAPVPERVVDWAPLLIAFSAGALLYLYADRISAGIATTAIAFAVLLVVGLFGLIPALGSMPIAFLLLQLGTRFPPSKVGLRYDISYGIYIYGWPVQQLLVLAFPNQQLSPLLFILLTCAVVTPLAWLSSALVEKPAQKLGRGSHRVADARL
jgi:peptidoglycan/LPS O-acetylase OafA/YrhL